MTKFNKMTKVFNRLQEIGFFNVWEDIKRTAERGGSKEDETTIQFYEHMLAGEVDKAEGLIDGIDTGFIEVTTLILDAATSCNYDGRYFSIKNKDNVDLLVFDTHSVAA